MSRKYLSLCILLLIPLICRGANGDKFTSNSTEGITISFTVYNESAKTAWVSVDAINTASEGVLTIPSITNGYTITGVYGNAFRNCNKLTTIAFPSTISSFKYYESSFNGCSANIVVDSENENYFSRNGALYQKYSSGCGLLFAGGSCTSFTIENDVTSIFNGAFYNSTHLKTITFEESSSAINLSSNNYNYYDPAFKNCPLTEAIINRVITTSSSINRPFKNNTTLEKVTLGSQINELKDYEFYGCTNLETITIQGNMFSIGYHVLDATAWYTNTPTEKGLKYLDNLAIAYDGTTADVVFKNTTSAVAMGLFINAKLGRVVLPSGITTIPKTMFACCTIEELVIPSNINRITYNSFYQGYSTITKIGTLTIEDSNSPLILESKYDATTAAFRKVEIGTVIIGRPLQTYRYSEGAQDYGYPFGETTINKAIITRDISTSEMFYNSKVKEVEFPTGMSSIADYTFYGCTTLNKVISKSNTPPTVSSNSFYNPYYKNATLYVPIGYKNNYSGADYWKDFNNIKYYNADEIIVPSYNICTYSSTNDLDFSGTSGLSAYVISEYNSTEGTLTLSPVTTVKAGEGLLLKGEAGEYVVPHTTTDATYTNYLVGVQTTTSVSPTNGDYTNFIIADGEHGVKFYALSQESNIISGDAYLPIPTADLPSNAIASGIGIIFGDEKQDKKCATPIIKVNSGLVNLSCETEGVTFKTSVTYNSNNENMVGNKLILSSNITCNLSVYATKEGYEDSDVATTEITLRVGAAGDANADGEVDIADAVHIVNFIVGKVNALSRVRKEKTESQ